MVLQNHKLKGSLDLVFTIIGPFLQTINIDRVISINTIFSNSYTTIAFHIFQTKYHEPIIFRCITFSAKISAK